MARSARSSLRFSLAERAISCLAYWLVTVVTGVEES